MKLANRLMGSRREWSPAEIMTGLWFDAADAATITNISGYCDAWADKSGNGFNVTAYDSSKRPQIISNARNGLPILRFQGSNNVLRRLSALTGLLQNVSGASIFTVQRYAVAPASAGVLVCINGGTTTVARAILDGGRVSGRWGVAGRRLDADEFQTIPSAFSADTGYHIVSGLYDYSAALAALWLDGSVNASATFQTSGLTSNTPPARLVIGATVDVASAYYNGDVAEIVVLNRTPDTAERQKIEGYLAHKWLTTVTLPSDHPYKSIAP